MEPQAVPREVMDRVEHITLNLTDEGNSIRAQRTKRMFGIMIIIIGVTLGLIYGFNVRSNFFGQQHHIILSSAVVTVGCCCIVATIAKCIAVSVGVPQLGISPR